ncbi:conserved membrane hypothetical protein [Arthrobacter sp. 9AX]|uniref:hypothetical protein n=1 Tax=Arthrobacter sp. 9AX TaxID=2653131 RepID=UPI0012EFF95A|nr:hypothetical protein [Arthrobacter sp. 9AX]VXC22008.1 conserved membrane hypothetical protein [Arthrobacter sp. 9AX]
MNWLAGLFLVAHGLVHAGIWCTPFDPAKAPFDPRHSWLAARLGLAGPARRVSVMLALAAAILFVISGLSVIANAPWAGAVAIVAAGVSLALTVLVFHRWLSLNLLINTAIIWVVSASG